MCRRHTPPAIRRRQTLRAQSMPRRNAAPLCQGDDPQSDPTTNSLRFAFGPPAESILGQRTTSLLIRESCQPFPSQNAALKCVDALAAYGGGEGIGPAFFVIGRSGPQI